MDDEINVATVVDIIRRTRIDLSNEKVSQSDLAQSFEESRILFTREVRLSKSDIIDFMIGSIGIEVKLHGANKKAVYRQLCRYATHERVSSLILATNLSMGLPETIEGKDVFIVRLGEGWL